MSAVELYTFPEDGPGRVWKTFGNSWLGATWVWSALSKAYLGEKVSVFDEAGVRAVWDLWKDPRLARFERVALLSTFDHALVRFADFAETAHHFDEFNRTYVEEVPSKTTPGNVEVRTSHLGAEAYWLRQLSEGLYVDEEPVACVGWRQTTVAPSEWHCRHEECPEGCAGRLGYKDNPRHWFVYDDLAKLEAS